MVGVVAVCTYCMTIQVKIAIPPRNPDSLCATGFEHWCPVCKMESHFEKLSDIKSLEGMS